MSLRDDAEKTYTRTKSTADHEYYKSLKNYVIGSIDREKTAYFKHFVNSNIHNPAKMWKHIKQTSLFHNNTSDPDIPSELNNPNNINNHFLNIPGNPVADTNLITHFNNISYNNKEFNLSKVTESDILKILNTIKCNAAGHDTITIKMIFLTLPYTLPVITAIINESINQHTFPDSWKQALVRPIPKSNAIEQYKDLRPISLLPTLSKILEKVVKTQIVTYITNEKILPTVQSGFRSGHGTETALLEVTDDFLTAADSTSCSALILLDFSRAFDCINIELMIAKLKYYGFSKNTCQWFKSYLIGRRQIVVTQDEKGNRVYSEPGMLTRGTPQGAILSPILFTLYTADLPGLLEHCKCHLYADDTQIYLSFKPSDTLQAMEMINKDLKSIHDWAEANSLALNPHKSKFLIIGNRQQREKVLQFSPKVLINGLEIPKVEKARNLGLVMDDDLRFEDHISEKVRNAFYKIKVLYGLRKHLTVEVRETLVELLVLSPFQYCSAVYGPRLWVKTEKVIQRVQNACARFCYNIPKRAHITPYLNKHNLLNMKNRRDLHFASLTHKVVWNKCPSYLYEKLKWFKDGTAYITRTRESDLLRTPKHQGAGFKGGFKYKSAKIWNNIPPPLRAKISSKTFRTKYKKILLQSQK